METHKHNIILHSQHGFQSGLSCESQLIQTVHDWITGIDNKTQIDTILLDFAKAFDKVPHKCLLSKLAFYGITGNTKNRIKLFLSHCKQRVSVNGSLITSGVPQGSVLGPVLFLLYINDINNNIQSTIRLFADDSIIYRKNKSETDNNILQSDLIQLQSWSKKWQMYVSPNNKQNKTQTTFVFHLWCATLHSLQPLISWNKIRY